MKSRSGAVNSPPKVRRPREKSRRWPTTLRRPRRISKAPMATGSREEPVSGTSPPSSASMPRPRTKMWLGALTETSRVASKGGAVLPWRPAAAIGPFRSVFSFRPARISGGVLIRRIPGRGCTVAGRRSGTETSIWDTLSEGELSLIRRTAALECELEAMEARMSQGEPVNLELFGRLTDRLGRTLQRIGLKRVPRDVTPSLADYLAGLQSEPEAAEAVEADEAANHEGEPE